MDQTRPVESLSEHAAPSYPSPALTRVGGQRDLAPTIPARHPALTAAPDALTLLKALRRRWVPALIVAVLAAGTIGPLAWFVIPPSKYTARASLHIATVPRRIMFDARDNTHPETYQRTVVALLRDQFVLSHALSSPDVAGLPTIKDLAKQDADIEDWLAKNLSVSFREGSEVLEVALNGDQPKDVAAIVNAVVDSYMTLVVEEETKSRLTRLEKLKDLWGRYQRELKVKRKSLEEVAASAGSHDELTFAVAQQFKAAQLSTAHSEQMRAKSDLLKAKAELAALEKAPEPASEPVAAPAAPEPDAPAADLDAAVEQHPSVVQLSHEIAALDQKLRAATQRTRNQADVYLLKLRGQKQDAQKELTALRRKVHLLLADRPAPAPVSGPSNAPIRASDRARLAARLRAHIEVLEGFEKALAQDAERLQKEMKDSSKSGLDLESERQEITIATDFAQKVGAEVEAVQVELNAPDRVRVLARAKPPRLKDESKRIKMGGAAALGSFALSLLGIAFWEFRARRVDSHDEVVNILGMKLVGTLPDLSRRTRRLPAPAGDGAASAQSNWQSPLVESVNAARTMLLHASRVEAMRTVMIASAVKGEGKTSLACHLATSLARAGRKVVLVDGDLRRASMHRLFKRPLADGLCELLRGEVGIQGVIQPSGVANLEIITAGRCDSVAVQALAREGLAALFARLRVDYDFVIIDSAPILPLADSLLIAQGVDGVVFSVLRHHSRLPEVQAARERLAVLGVKVIGAVVSGVPGEVYHDYYYSNEHANS